MGVFACYYTSMIQEIIKTLEEISENKNEQPLYVLGGYIVGATLVRNDADELFRQYPLLEPIAELGAELETLEGDTYAMPMFKEFQHILDQLKESLA